MKTRLSVLACVLALASAGCVDNDASIEILAICAPPEDAEQCRGTSGECEMYLASDRPWVYTRRSDGTLNRLEEFVQINNQLPNNADPDVFRANTNDFIAEEYVLEFKGANGVPKITHPANFAIPASSSFSPVIPIIPESAMTFISAALPDSTMPRLVIAEITLRGRLVDGSEIETGVFSVAVDVFDAVFPGFGCPKPTEIVTAVCPNDGQTASVTCEEP